MKLVDVAVVNHVYQYTISEGYETRAYTVNPNVSQYDNETVQ